MSLTDPVCPGRRYLICWVKTFQMYTLRSAEPQATCLPSGVHAHLIKFFSNPCCAPKKVCESRCFENGRTSHILTVLSMEFESTWFPSGLNFNPVIVSVCPESSKATLNFRVSHTLITLSKPPVMIVSVVVPKQALVTWYLFAKECKKFLRRESHILIVPSSDPVTTNGSSPRAGQHEFTIALWPRRRRMRVPVCTSHTAHVLSVDAERSWLPSGVQCTSKMAPVCPVRAP